MRAVRNWVQQPVLRLCAMRLATSFAGAGVLVALGFFSYRILALEQRVAVLDKASSARTTTAPATSPIESVNASDERTPKDVETRIQSFQKRVGALENAPRGLPTNNGIVDEARLREEQAILSVIERESRRVQDAQLDWHKAHWMDARKQHLAAFASSQKLKPAQTAKLNAAIERELNAIVDVMKRPSFAEEPDEVANDWLEVLSETDRQAQAVLDPDQYQTWQQGRVLGRKLLWPWLPDKPKEASER